MCAIAGEVSWGQLVRTHDTADVVARMRHRGPDDTGVWSSAKKDCVLGHARLSIIDLSPSGHQPMIDPETGNIIVFNGEIYNFQALRTSCEAAGDRFRSTSDTEVILALYRRHGEKCLSLLRGMFAFALWDAGRERLLLARDRVGKKPLNYALTPAGLVFASELSPLSHHPKISTAIDPEALDLYLQLQYIPAPWTIYRQIRKLPPAHYALFDRDGLRIQNYWDVDYTQKLRISEAEALERLDETLTEAVRLRMIADVPLGALLSGGVDSSLIVAIMAKLCGEPVRTFSIGFEQQAFNELPFAQQAADRWKTSHHPEVVHGNVASLLPTIARHYGEPFADSSAVPSFLVSAMARKHVTVALNGDGGDELLGGYPRYWLPTVSIRAGAVGRLIPAGLLARVAPTLAGARSIPERAIRKLLMEYVSPGLRSIGAYSEFWNDPQRAALLGTESSLSVLPSWRTKWLSGSNRRARNPIDQMLWIDNRTYLPGDLLAKMDIASMHCGLETRSPLLDHELIELCASLPVELKVNRRVGKYLLKRLAERYYPRDFIYRRKMGFGVPLADWLRGPLKGLMMELLCDSTATSPLNPYVIRETLREFDQGVEHSSRLWALLMYAAWNSSRAN